MSFWVVSVQVPAKIPVSLPWNPSGEQFCYSSALGIPIKTTDNDIQVVPHKAVAEVSKIGNL